MVRNKYKGINDTSTIPVMINGKKIGIAIFDCAYREVKFHINADSAEYRQFMDAFNKTGIDGFAITVRGGNHEEVR